MNINLNVNVTLADTPALTNLIDALSGRNRYEEKMALIKMRKDLKRASNKLIKSFEPNVTKNPS